MADYGADEWRWNHGVLKGHEDEGKKRRGTRRDAQQDKRIIKDGEDSRTSEVQRGGTVLESSASTDAGTVEGEIERLREQIDQMLSNNITHIRKSVVQYEAANADLQARLSAATESATAWEAEALDLREENERLKEEGK